MGNRRRRSRHQTLSWLIALLATLESLFQAFDAFLDGRDDKLMLWATASVLAAILSLVLEKYKLKGAKYN